MLTQFMQFAVIVGILLAGHAGAASGLLTGAWQCGDSSLVFRSETALVYKGEQMRYRRIGNVLRVQEEYGPVDYPFVLSGNRLDVTFPGGSIVQCVRAKAAPERSAAGGTGPAGSESQLRGMLCRWSGSSGMSGSFSSSTRVNFDGAGRFTYSSESSFSGNAGSGYGSGPGAGGTYRVAGDVVHLTFGDGSRGTAKVNMRQNNGRITEIMFNGQLYATGLCQ
jgi:hypothetical protein